MRRWVTILLMFLLPFQFSWAVAAGYCQHEEVSGVSHFGHHAHQHQADEKASGSAGKHLSKNGGLVADGDCGFCHLSLAKPLPEPLVQFDSVARYNADTLIVQAYRSRGPDHPERPNWRIA